MYLGKCVGHVVQLLPIFNLNVYISSAIANLAMLNRYNYFYSSKNLPIFHCTGNMFPTRSPVGSPSGLWTLPCDNYKGIRWASNTLAHMIGCGTWTRDERKKEQSNEPKKERKNEGTDTDNTISGVELSRPVYVFKLKSVKPFHLYATKGRWSFHRNWGRNKWWYNFYFDILHLWLWSN